jgi:hypothetical protein
MPAISILGPLSGLTTPCNRLICKSSASFAADDLQPFERDMGSSNSGDRIAANAVPMASILITKIRDRRVYLRGYGKA